MKSATNNNIVAVVDSEDFWRTNAAKLEGLPISLPCLRRFR